MSMSQKVTQWKRIYDIKNQNFITRKGQMQNKYRDAIKPINKFQQQMDSHGLWLTMRADV